MAGPTCVLHMAADSRGCEGRGNMRVFSMFFYGSTYFIDGLQQSANNTFCFTCTDFLLLQFLEWLVQFGAEVGLLQRLSFKGFVFQTHFFPFLSKEKGSYFYRVYLLAVVPRELKFCISKNLFSESFFF